MLMHYDHVLVHFVRFPSGGNFKPALNYYPLLFR
jgi:hypothetical protein